MRNRTSGLRIPRSDALPLSHRDSTVSEVYYEVHMTRILRTARISNVDGLSNQGRRKAVFSDKSYDVFIYCLNNFLPLMS